MAYYHETTELVEQVGSLPWDRMPASVIFRPWVRHIGKWKKATTPKKGEAAAGKYWEPDMLALAVLGEVVYWYRPAKRKTEDGEEWGRKFKADQWQASTRQLAKVTGFSHAAVAKALDRLERDYGVIRVEHYDVELADGRILPNTQFIEPVFERLREITEGPAPECREVDI
jgi:hypothetical protein